MCLCLGVCVCVCLCVCVSEDPAPVLEATHTLEERLQQLQGEAPGSEALVREISGHWRRHLECLDKPGESHSTALHSSGLPTVY